MDYGLETSLWHKIDEKSKHLSQDIKLGFCKIQRLGFTMIISKQEFRRQNVLFRSIDYPPSKRILALLCVRVCVCVCVCVWLVHFLIK
jgi:hypothetical protein